jgi:hypothetical protein
MALAQWSWRRMAALWGVGLALQLALVALPLLLLSAGAPRILRQASGRASAGLSLKRPTRAGPPSSAPRRSLRGRASGRRAATRSTPLCECRRGVPILLGAQRCALGCGVRHAGWPPCSSGWCRSRS